MFIFSHFNLDLGYWYVIWKVSPINRWRLKKPSVHYIRVVGDLMQNLSSLLISLVVTCALINDYRALLDLQSSESEFLRTCRTPLHIKSCFLVWWGRDGELVWLRKSIAWQRGCLRWLELGGNYAWCLLTVVIFMGLEGAKRLGEVLKSWYGMEIVQKNKRWDLFHGEADRSRRHVVISSAGIHFLHSFLELYKHIKNWRIGNAMLAIFFCISR